MTPALVLALILVIAGSFAYRFWLKRHNRAVLLAAPLSQTERAIILDEVPLLRKLPTDLQPGFEGKVRLFLSQVEFIGCDGLEVTENMRLSIAAQACLIVANSDAWYKHLRTILMYPGAFKSMHKTQSEFIVTEGEQVRLGESWGYGPVVLSWAHSEAGAANDADGHNVVIHEFAHQLDHLSGHTDGAPILAKGQSFAEYERVILKAYDRHVENVEQGRDTVLDAYGATNYEEFFAVSVEVFFEKPERLKREEPDVYTQLSTLLALDPAGW